MKPSNEYSHQVLPCWIWHPDKGKRKQVVLSKSFTLEKETASMALFVACTGDIRVELNGGAIASLPEHAQHVAVFQQIKAFPTVLAAGDYTLKVTSNCREPMPLEPVNAHLADRTVGCIAFLQEANFWLATDNTWQADDTRAEIVCRLGEEPYGDLGNTPDWFVRGGYGDITVDAIEDFDVISASNITAKRMSGGLFLNGIHSGVFDMKQIDAREKFLFYHLRKQEEWKQRRSYQKQMELSSTPRLRIDLKKEWNTRFQMTNTG